MTEDLGMWLFSVALVLHASLGVRMKTNARALGDAIIAESKHATVMVHGLAGTIVRVVLRTDGSTAIVRLSSGTRVEVPVEEVET